MIFLYRSKSISPGLRPFPAGRLSPVGQNLQWKLQISEGSTKSTKGVANGMTSSSFVLFSSSILGLISAFMVRFTPLLWPALAGSQANARRRPSRDGASAKPLPSTIFLSLAASPQ